MARSTGILRNKTALKQNEATIPIRASATNLRSGCHCVPDSVRAAIMTIGGWNTYTLNAFSDKNLATRPCELSFSRKSTSRPKHNATQVKDSQKQNAAFCQCQPPEKSTPRPW